jgi:hypothetical protein
MLIHAADAAMRTPECSCRKSILSFIIILCLAVRSILYIASFAGFLDPKTTPPRDVNDAINVTVYLFERDPRTNHALSVFKTDVLRRYGTGRLWFALHKRAECNFECTNSDEPHPSLMLAPCLAVTAITDCDHEHVKCMYPQCKTMITNDEFCQSISLPFDVRQYYTTNGPQQHHGYLPLGPRWDSWLSFQKIYQEVDLGQFVIPPSSERDFAFNAVFSRSTNIERQKLANTIEGENSTLKFRIFSFMAKEWSHDANSDRTEQLHTDDYMRVLLESVFTLTPAGHNPECFRMFEAVEAGSIPILTRDDLYGRHHPMYPLKPHPCTDALLHWYGAPIVVLDSWDDLYPTVERLMADPAGLDDLQRRVRHWYDEYMRGAVAKFEDVFLS